MMPKFARKYGQFAKRRVVGPILQPFRGGNIAMFHVGRSGSTVLGDLLNQHPRICWDGEIFPMIYKPMFDDWQSWRQSSDERAQLDLAKPIRSRMSWAGRNWYGFETKFFHLGLLTGIKLSDYLHQLDHLGFSHFIILRRKNLLRKIVSGVIAGQTRDYHRDHDQEPSFTRISLDTDKIYLDQDVKSLLDLLHEYEDDFKQLDELLTGERTLRLTYEDDIASDPLAAYGKTVEFLGLETHDVAIRYAKTNPYPLQEILINLNQVENELSGTQFAWMVYE